LVMRIWQMLEHYPGAPEHWFILLTEDQTMIIIW